jgi:thymidylate synthase
MPHQYHDQPYLNLIETVLSTGVQKGDRTGTGTLSVFAEQMRFDISGGSIPLLTTKKMFIRGIIHEIIWYLQGDTNIKYLNDNKVRIWDEWADENGDLGPIYGEQWCRWKKHSIMQSDHSVDATKGGNVTTHTNATVRVEEINQIAQVIETLKNNPNSRRIIINAWNVADIEEAALPPCHAMFQFWAHDGKLKCQLYQRSCDIGLGVPFNIVQYSILTHMIAQVTGLEASEFIWTGGDCHIYNNHIDLLREQATRIPKASPTLSLNPDITNINDFTYDDFTINDYNDPYPAIKMEVSV